MSAECAALIAAAFLAGGAAVDLWYVLNSPIQYEEAPDEDRERQG